jgi:hypothetical protein
MAPFLFFGQSMRDTNLILYTPGAYGNFINWCCSYFGGLTTDINIPFTAVGSVHNFYAGQKHLMISKQLYQYLESAETFPFVQSHEVTLLPPDETAFKKSNFDILNTYLPRMVDEFKQIIYVYPTLSSWCCLIDNQISKIKTFEDAKLLGINDPLQYLMDLDLDQRNLKLCELVGMERIKFELATELSQENLMQWGHENINQFSLWELRELGSIYYYDRCLSHILTDDQLSILKTNFPSIQYIPLDQLRDNFNNTMQDILKLFKINVNNISELEKIYQSWIPTQKHIFADRYINEIVYALENEIDFQWTGFNISFFDEIIIQRKLSDKGLKINCYDIDQFPTNTKDFLPLLERI